MLDKRALKEQLTVQTVAGNVESTVSSIRQRKGYFYLIIHERVSTRDRGHRLMPLRFPSNLCLHCGVDRDTYQHRYLYCPFASEVWDWVWSIAVKLDPLISNYDNI